MDYPPSKAAVLSTIWSASRGTYVYIPRLNRQGRWDNGEAMTVEQALVRVPFMNPREGDMYFSPLRYNGLRRRGSVGQPGVIFADLDGDHVITPRLKPSVIVVSSPGHYHGYWLLDEPAEPAEWEPRAKGWTQEMGGDPAGWDITQVLRVPDTLNFKYEGSDRKVSVQSFHPERRYSLSDFPEAVVPLPVSPGEGPVVHAEQLDRRNALAFGTTLPLASRYWLTATRAELAALGPIDRSKVSWAVMRSLVEAGFDPYDVFALMHFSAINKWPDDPARLWSDVQRAFAA